MIKVRLAATKKWQEIEYREGMKAKDIFRELRYHPASIALIILNGTPTDENAELKDGDELVFVPTVGGGVSRSINF